MVGYKFAKEFYELDPEKKNREWFDMLITDFRRYMQWFVDPVRAKENRQFLFGEQSMEEHKKKFKKPDELPFKFEPLAVFEKYRNILMAEREKAGIYINLKAIDPSALADRQSDAKFLKNRAFIEGEMSGYQSKMGLPNFNLMNEKDEKGEKIFRGNIDLFDELGLNDQSSEDVAYFFKTFFRLDTEIEAEQVVNFFVKYHKLHEYIKYWSDDILAVKALVGRVFTNEFTSTPSYRRYKPETLKWVPGKRDDGKDAKAFMLEENMTISDFAAMVGCEIGEAEIDEFLTAANFLGNTAYDGVDMGGRRYPATCGNPLSYDNFKELKISVGYIEFKSWDANAKKVGTNRKGNFRSMNTSLTDPVSKSKNYRKEICSWQTTYKAYFVSTSTASQKVYAHGPLNGMVTHGSEDEHSEFSFQVYRYSGKSAVEVAIPHIKNIHDAWFRFCWFLNKAKPKGTMYNYNAIAAVAKKMFAQDAEANAVMRYVKLLNESIDGFYVNDILNDKLGGGQNPHFDRPNGIDPAIDTFSKIIVSEQDHIADKLGINSIREAYSPNPNDGYKLQMQALAQSRNATEYISRMIMDTLTSYAEHTLQIVQNLIEFRSSRYHKVLERALGRKTIDTIATLKRVPLHKYGIFVDSFNSDIDKQKQKQEAFDAWKGGEIDYKTYMLITSVDNYKKAAQIMAYELKKAEDRKREDQQRLHQQAMELKQQENEFQMELKRQEGRNIAGKQQLANQGMITVEQLDGQVKLILKKMGIDSEGGKQMARTTAKLAEEKGLKDIQDSDKFLTQELAPSSLVG